MFLYMYDYIYCLVIGCETSMHSVYVIPVLDLLQSYNLNVCWIGETRADT